MMFTFPLEKVREIIARGISEAATNGGFRGPYYGLIPGKGEKPGLWLVGNEGVYLCSKGTLAEGQKPLICYARRVRSVHQSRLFALQARHFGGDDGVDFLDVIDLERLMGASPSVAHRRTEMTDTSMSLSLMRR